MTQSRFQKHCIRWVALLFTQWLLHQTSLAQVVIATSDSPPYTTSQYVNGGFVNHVVTKAFSEVGMDVKFEYVIWARSYQETVNGGFDATSYWYNDPKHHDDFLVSDNLSTEVLVFFKLKSTKIETWQPLSVLRRHRIGLTRGYTYTKALWEHAQDNNQFVSVVNRDLQNMNLLLLGRIDLFPIGELHGWYMLTSNFPAEQVQMIETMRPAIDVKTGHLFFPKIKPKSKQLVDAFNKGLSIIKANGTFDALKQQLIDGHYSKNKETINRNVD